MADTTAKQKRIYVEAGKKLEDASSTAWSFMFLGILGFAALLLVWVGILPMDIPFSTLVMGSIVFGILFLIFILVSLRAFRDRKKLIPAKAREEADVCRIRNWFQEHYSADAISHGMDEEDIPMEDLYFLRLENISRLLAEEFPEFEASFSEYLMENIYQMYFG
ncbi:MAG: hypothetical protein HFH36_13825 [Lachnospiraceae bacterium]|nr:hypothetical protein [Lachnospiraceae bacterium]